MRDTTARPADQVLAFNNRQESLRLGPELALHIWPSLNTSAFLSRFSGLIGYDYYYETYAKKNLSWFTSSLTFNLDQAGNFGITGSYNRGRDEDTGTLTNIYKISLTGKI